MGDIFIFIYIDDLTKTLNIPFMSRKSGFSIVCFLYRFIKLIECNSLKKFTFRIKYNWFITYITIVKHLFVRKFLN